MTQMNPTIEGELIGAGALIVVALINYWGNKKTKDKIVEVGKRIDGRVDALIQKVHNEGFNEGMRHQRSIITEEAIRVKGVDLEAEKRAK